MTQTRRYYHSSSFKMALLFTIFLGVAVSILGYFTYLFSQNPEQHWLAALSALCIACMGVVIAVSFLISRFVVTRTNRIAHTAQEIINTGNLAQRLEIDSRWDDLSYMSSVLNQLFDRIEDLVLSVKQVSDNVAHDLRTPLTRLRNNLEKLGRDKALQNNPETHELCDSLIIEADRILDTFSALLRISDIEARRQKHRFREVSLDQVVRDVMDLYEPLAEEKHLRIGLALETAVIIGDRDLLFQAFANLLDNAIKFTPAGGRIQLSLAPQGSTFVFKISDSGPGVDAADHEKIFQRFYRTENSRHNPGNGLGLSLVAVVLELHEAKVRLTSLDPGLEISISFQK